MVSLGNGSRQFEGGSTESSRKTVVVAGANGALGQRIVHHLLARGVRVKALVRNKDQEPLSALQQKGATILEVDYKDEQALAEVCSGASCVVSALSGLQEVILEVQTALLNSAVRAGVPRFIPSDYCIDYTRLPAGSNRNLDFRRAFAQRLDGAPISATSILNGMFTDLLTGPAPVILFGLKRVVYWEDAEQLMDFTTMDDTAAYTAAAAMDAQTPRFLRIAGEESSARGLQHIAEQVTGQPFRLMRAGKLGRLRTMIRITKTLFPKKKEVFPPWQGMQYLHDMFSGRPEFEKLDNDRYPDIRWTPVGEVIAGRAA